MKLLAWVLLVSAALGSTTLAGPIPSAPIYTNKLRFRIPFHYDSAELQRLGAREIRLYVSRDQGRNWQQVQAVTPQAGKFNFQATADGEYWFIVRTLDSRNALHPDASNNEPGLQVIVDTTPPRLQLDLRQTTPGKVQLSWIASDPHLDPTQLRLEYVQPGTPDWRAISIVPKPSGTTDEWSVPEGGLVAVRGSISDLARNTAQDQVERRVAAANQAVPRPRTPDLRQPVAGSGNVGIDPHSLSMSDEFPGAMKASGTPATPASSTPREGSIPFTAMRTGNESGGPRGSFVSQKSGDFPDAPKISGDEPEPAQEAKRSKSAGTRAVSSRKFQIGYKLQDVDPEAVQAVELFITPNDGETWYRYGVDEDKTTPAQIEVRQDGLYGFALGVRTRDGNFTDVPANGDPPAIEVIVDQTPPTVELMPLRQGRGANANKILVQWKCSDEFPADLPVALSYAASAEGPWHRIGDWMENTGRYVWTVDSSIPSRFLLRVDARDRAGNTKSAETPQPVLLDLNRPTARILGVESHRKAAAPQ